MKMFIDDLLKNHSVVCAVTAWTVAQTLKMLIVLLLERELILERLFGAGGMPSGHSATVCSLMISTARTQGVTSPLFTVTMVLAFIVMYDAFGVRRAAGEHAKMINLFRDIFKLEKPVIDPEKDEDQDLKDLKEQLGHTPFQVLCGAILGTVIAFAVPLR